MKRSAASDEASRLPAEGMRPFFGFYGGKWREPGLQVAAIQKQ
jgi:hypothetical protein